MNIIGIRKEDKEFETRVPLIPKDVAFLMQKYGIHFIVEPSNQRIFTDLEYQNVGAELRSLKESPAKIILGIKEMPPSFFENEKVYVFFSHTIKGQHHNMPMLKQILIKQATLIDYERIIDSSGRRLVFFGNWAGLAGMADTLRIFGLRLDYEKIFPNPFQNIKPTIECKNLDKLKKEIKLVAERINHDGLPKELDPLVVGFAGYGNVSRGAQEIFDILPHEIVEPSELANLKPLQTALYKCVFKEEHIVSPKDPNKDFSLEDYYKYGSKKYKGVFHKYVPYLTIIMNCIYWNKNYPRLITKKFIQKYWTSHKRKLRVIGDISCDIKGAIEFTTITTKPNQPAFTYLVKEDKPKLGVIGDGPVVIAVDNLPCELPQEASTSFSKSLIPFIPFLANADFAQSFEKIELPPELKRAVIVYQGQLTENYKYLIQYLAEGN